MSGDTGCLFRDRSWFHERAAQVVVRIDWTRSALQSSQSLQVMINSVPVSQFHIFQGYTLYIQLENAIPLGHLQVAISQKRKELPENHWSTERMLPNFLFHVHNTYVYIHHTYMYTPYVYMYSVHHTHYLRECKS